MSRSPQQMVTLLVSRSLVICSHLVYLQVDIKKIKKKHRAELYIHVCSLSFIGFLLLLVQCLERTFGTVDLATTNFQFNFSRYGRGL